MKANIHQTLLSLQSQTRNASRWTFHSSSLVTFFLFVRRFFLHFFCFLHLIRISSNFERSNGCIIYFRLSIDDFALIMAIFGDVETFVVVVVVVFGHIPADVTHSVYEIGRINIPVKLFAILCFSHRPNSSESLNRTHEIRNKDIKQYHLASK